MTLSHSWQIPYFTQFCKIQPQKCVFRQVLKSCLDSALALDGIGTIIESELKQLIDKSLFDYKEREKQREDNSAWFTSYVRDGFPTAFLRL